MIKSTGHYAIGNINVKKQNLIATPDCLAMRVFFADSRWLMAIPADSRWLMAIPADSRQPIAESHYNDNTLTRHPEYSTPLKTRQTVPPPLCLHRCRATRPTPIHLLHHRKHHPQNATTRTLGFPILHGIVAEFLRYFQFRPTDPDSIRHRVLPPELRADNRLRMESTDPLCFRPPNPQRRRTPAPLPTLRLRF